MWDAGQYLKFADERGRPFFDLLAQVRIERPRRVIDLGCGPGNLTRTLADRWPDAHVLGVDSSTEMLQKAAPLAIPGRLEFVQADAHTWSPDGPIDLLLSNAALQWVADHATLIPRLAAGLAPGGVLAVQMPDRFHNTSAQAAIEATSADPRWADTLRGVGLHRDSVHPLEWYVRTLLRLGFAVNAWDTTYLHVLTGDDPVLEWFKGSALRPLLARLDAKRAEEFQRDLAARFREAYPAVDGVTLLPFPRLFFVATRPSR
jgi:trans-aconitate 2-methyltransferase